MEVIKRRAILIGSPGKGKNFLKGVQHDIDNLIRFLMSERGGSFYRNEIEDYLNPSLDELSSAILGTEADYQFVYFSGHGYTDNLNRRMVSLMNYAVPDTFLLGNCPRQLVILDACRTFAGSGVGAIPGLGDQYDSFAGSPAREIFNQWIAQSPFGRLILHATESGMYAEDTSFGGAFTKTWIECANRYIPAIENEYSPIMVPQLLNDVRILLNKKGSSQVPGIVYHRGNLQVPFALKVHHHPVLTYESPFPRKASFSPNAWFGLALLGIVVFAVATGEI